MRSTTVLLIATLLLATSTAGCIGEKYLDRLVGDDDDKKDRGCNKECREDCRENGGTDEQCREYCAELDKREKGNDTVDSEPDDESSGNSTRAEN